MGVVFPVAVMGGVSLLFGFKPIPAAFIGVVFSATSVSISVAVLKEAGLLDSKEGVSILGAAVADDVIGVILLSVMCTLVNTGSVDVAGLGLILLKQVLFFVAAAVVVVWVAPALMTLAGVLKAPSGIAVMAVIICLAMAWASNLAGLSYAVGAFFAGIAVSNSDYAEDADRYIEPVGDTLFVPVFFVGIGLQTTGVDDTKMIVFIAIMTVLGVITKVVGCGLGGRMAGFGGASALMIGAGMVPRGEMALITAQIGFNEHVLGSEYYSTIIFIISLVTLVAPLLLKLTIRKVPGVGAAAAGTEIANPENMGTSGEDAVDETFRIERSEIVRAFAQADELDGHAELLLHGDDDAALGGAVELGQDHAGDADRFGEHLGLRHAVLAGGGVEHEQHFVHRQVLFGDAADLAELVHEVRLVLQAAGGVDDEHVGVLFLGLGTGL